MTPPENKTGPEVTPGLSQFLCNSACSHHARINALAARYLVPRQQQQTVMTRLVFMVRKVSAVPFRFHYQSHHSPYRFTLGLDAVETDFVRGSVNNPPVMPLPTIAQFDAAAAVLPKVNLLGIKRVS